MYRLLSRFPHHQALCCKTGNTPQIPQKGPLKGETGFPCGRIQAGRTHKNAALPNLI
jgi:hypothetical protein